MFAKPELPSLAENTTDPFLSLENGATEVYLIRHANALPSTNEVADGGYDAQALSELGRRQSLALADRMRNISVAAIHSSPIKRALQTATFVGGALGLEVHTNEDLREVGLPIPSHFYTDLEPEERATAIQTYLHQLETMALQVGIWSQIPGCEPSEHFRTRITRAIDHIASHYIGKRIAIITHAGAINAYIASFLALERDFFFPVAYTSISVVRVKDQHHLLLRLNDGSHWQREGA